MSSASVFVNAEQRRFALQFYPRLRTQLTARSTHQGHAMEPAADETEDLTSNIAEAELDRPGYLPTTADCVKWAADGRIAVNVGLMVLLYQPRFEGRDRYDFTAFSVACPDVDRTILDLQRFPGKVGDAVEFARKGLKYLAADDPDHLEKCSVGGDSNTVSGMAWSPRGCAWDGGCLLCVVSCLHAVTVFQPPRDSPDGMEWEPLATVSSALLHWGLRVCPTDGAATYMESLNLDHNDDSGGGGGDGGFALKGLWVVARATRTRAVAWMDRRVSLTASSGGGGDCLDVGQDGGGAFTLLAMAGDFVITLWALSSEATPAAAAGEGQGEEEEGGRSLGLVRERPAWAGDLRSMGTRGGDGNVRALAWCHESVSTSPSGGYDNGATGSSSPSRPTRDFLAIGTSAGTVLVLAVDIGTDADAMAATAVESPASLPHVDAGGRGSSALARVRSGGIRAAVTAVPLRRVCVSDGSPVTFLAFVVPRSSGWGAGSSEQGDSGDSPPSSPRAALAVAKGAMVSLFPLVTATASNIHDQQDNQLPATGPTATVRVTAGATTAEGLAASGPAREATPSPPRRFAATPDERQPAAVTWRAHDHNVTGISTVPFAAPVSNTASPPSLAGTSPSSTAAPSGPGAPATVVGNGKHRQDGEGGGGGSCASGAATSVGDAGAGRDDSSQGGGADRARVGGKRRRREEGDAGGGCRRNGGRAKALVYTCSMDGSCREWEVEVAVSPGGDGGGGGREGAAKARLRKTVSRLTKRGQQSPLRNPPPLLGCSASPNGVLVASLEFCRPERSTRKAVQNTARKGTHCRVVLTPMVPPAAERAATVTGGRDSSWNFSLSSGVLLTDWAWYIRAAILGDAAVHSTREDMTPFSLIPTVRNALEDAILKAAEGARQGAPTGATRSRPRLKTTMEATAAAAADEVAVDVLPRDSNGGGSSNDGGGFGGTTASSSSSGSSRTPALLWDLLHLHHVFLATAASVAGCQADVHVPPVADNGDGPGDTDEDEDEDGDDDGGGGGDDNSSCGGNGDGDDGAAAADAASDGDMSGVGSRDGKGGEDEEEEDEEETAGSLDAASSRKAAPTRKPGMPPPPTPQKQPKPRPRSSSKQVPPPKKNTTRFAGNCPAPSRPRRYRNESELDKKSAASMATVKRIKRRKSAADRVSAAELAARASTAASAARSRLALMRAWEQVRLLPGDVASGVGRATPTTVPKDAVSATAAAVHRGGGSGGSVDDVDGTAAGTGAVQQRQPAAVAKQRAAAERCLRAACGLASARSRSALGLTGGTAGGFLAGPLATPVIDLPLEQDVRAALLEPEGSRKMHDNGVRHGSEDISRGGVEGVTGQAAAPALLSSSAGPHSAAGEETCLLCGAPILSDAAAAAAAAAAAVAAARAVASADDPRACGTSSIVSTPAGVGASPAGGGGGGGGGGDGKVESRTAGEENASTSGRKGGGGEDGVLAGELELPGWVVCHRGHRFRRSMDTLAPIPGVGYRRCEVCRCVRALSPSCRDEEDGLGVGGSGGSPADLASPPDGSTCVFCNVMLASCGSAVSWRA